MLSYQTVEELYRTAYQQNRRISDVVLEDQAQQMEQSPKEVFARMEKSVDVMLGSIEKGSIKGVKSNSGLTGGDAYRLKDQIKNRKHVCGDLIATAIQMAVAVAEINAAMGKIVASPTAGSCGILPGAIGSLIKVQGVKKVDAVQAVFTAGAIGMVVANKASIAGAAGGCQAECGTASAMAAASIVELSGGNPEMVYHAVAIALKCVLGLVCDPVAGLVEIPCIKRNASGVSLAFTAAELALAGIKTVIPTDEVIEIMKKIGDNMSSTLKETAEGGLAVSPTGKMLEEQVFGTPSGSMCAGCSSCRTCL